MERLIYKKLEPFVRELIDYTISFYKDNLEAIVIFGSYARGEITFSSDIDILIVIDRANNTYRERLREFYKNVESKIKDMPYLSVSPIILTKDEAIRFNPIYLDIAENHIVIFDKGLFRSILEKLKEFQQKGIIERKTKEGKVYWRITDEEACRRLY